MSEHTKGPWEWSTGDPDLNNYGVYSNVAKERIAEVLNQSSANARLIAAAPDLLALLKDILEWDGILPHSKTRIRDTIAKATE